MTAYLHFDVGCDRDAYLDLTDELRRLDAKPNGHVNTAERALHNGREIGVRPLSRQVKVRNGLIALPPGV